MFMHWISHDFSPVYSYVFKKMGVAQNNSAKIHKRYIKSRHSEEDNAYDADTDDDNDDDLSQRYDGFGHFSCHKCEQLFGNKGSREIILYLN